MSSTDYQQLREHASRLREEAKKTPYWDELMQRLIKSNNELFVGPVSYAHVEDCFNYLLDYYDPNHREDQYCDLPEPGEKLELFNPFWSLMELDDQGKVSLLYVSDSSDCEMVGDFLSEFYEWQEEDW